MKLRISRSADPITSVTSKTGSIKSKTSADTTADIRDSISALVGKGYTSLSDDDARGHYARIVGVMGVPAAQKLMNHIFIYNQNPSARGVGLTEKINQFYNIGSRDSDVNNVLQKVKTFGSGTMSGIYDSPEIQNQELAGKNPLPSGPTDTEALKKVKLIVKGK